MGLPNKLFITAFIVVAASILVNEYAPDYAVNLMKYPVIRESLNIVHNFKERYFAGNEVKNLPKRPQEKLFSSDELKAYSGKEGNKGLYLAFMGVVYDVEKGKKFYGPGGGYEFFAGRDASRAFVTGDFTEQGLIDDVSGLSSSDYLGINDWVQFYEKDYTRVGKLIGRYFDEKGDPTQYNEEAQKWLRDSLLQKEAENEEKVQFPPCNSEWSPERGSRVYCTKKSGGVERDWVGVPRKLFSSLGKSERCACVKNFGAPTSQGSNSDRGDLDNPNLKEYPGCGAQQDSCDIPNK